MIYVGVDGGGTKTKLILYENQTKKAEVVVGPAMIDIEFREESIRNVLDGLDLLYLQCDISEPINSIFLGLSGNSNKENVETFKEALKHNKIVYSTLVTIKNDIHNAYESACSGRSSIALIIGTGSVGYAKNDKGNSHRVSGVNFYEGDLGSGYDIGISTLRYLSKCFDGREVASPFMSNLQKSFNISTYKDLSKLFFEYAPNRTKTASLAKMAYQYLEEKDPIAIKIFEKASSDILDIILALENKLNNIGKEIGVVGGLGNQPIYFKMIQDKVLKHNSDYIIHRADMDPCEGSVRLAKKYFIEN